MLDKYNGQFAQALRKSARVLIRQSSPVQKEKHTGSADVQLESIEALLDFGWQEDQIEVVDARGESGDFDKHRPRFNALLKEVSEGGVGIVTIGRGDRLGRNDIESSMFLKACADTKTYILDGRKLYNPAAVGDRMILQLFATFAQFENQARASWMMRTRFAKAKKMTYRIPLPTGLIWACPDDPEYRAALDECGLLDCLEDIACHKPASVLDGKTYHILPYPDGELARATRVALEWLLDTGDPGIVRDRIFDRSSGWPRPGKLPVATDRIYDGRKSKVEWKSSSKGVMWGRLRSWVKHPALYGYYRYRSPRLAEITLDAETKDFQLEIEDAFPSFAQPRDLELIREIYENKKKGWKRGAYAGPRRHALEMLRCGEELPTGGRCGYLYTAMYVNDGSYTYHSHACKNRGHDLGYVEGSVDQVVIEAVLSIFDPESIRSSIDSVRADEKTVLKRKRQLQREAEKARSDLEAASDLALKANREKNTTEEMHWRKRWRKLDKLVGQKELALKSVDREEQHLRELSKSDIKRIKALALDLPDLTKRAGESRPCALRRLLRELVSVVHFRRISGFAYEIEVEFPAGARVFRRIFTRNFVSTQPARIWAHGRLGDGADPDEVAKELNIAPPLNHRVEWNDERVRIAAYFHEHAEYSDEVRDGDYRPAGELAQDFDITRTEVLKAAFSDHLGPAKYDSGKLWLSPTKRELHFGIPDTAIHDVAREMNWPIEDVISRADVVRETEMSRRRADTKATAGSGLARDATGKIYMRRSEVMLTVAEAIRKELERTHPEWLELDIESWTPLAEVLKLNPQLTRRQIERDFPVVRPGIGYLGSKSTYVSMDGSLNPLGGGGD